MVCAVVYTAPNSHNVLCIIVCGCDVLLQRGVSHHTFASALYNTLWRWYTMHCNGVGQVKFSGVPALPPLCQPRAQSQRGKSVEKFDCHSQFAPFALVDLSKLELGKNCFLHVLPWYLGVFIFYITEETRLLLIWPMSKQLYKIPIKVSRRWRLIRSKCGNVT